MYKQNKEEHQHKLSILNKVVHVLNTLHTPAISILSLVHAKK